MYWKSHKVMNKVDCMSGGGDDSGGGSSSGVFGGSGSVYDPTSSAHARSMQAAEAALGGGPGHDYYRDRAREIEARERAVPTGTQTYDLDYGGAVDPVLQQQMNANYNAQQQANRQGVGGFSGYNTPAPTGTLPQQQVGWGYAQQAPGSMLANAAVQDPYQSLRDRDPQGIFRKAPGLLEQFNTVMGVPFSASTDPYKGAVTRKDYIAEDERRRAQSPGIYSKASSQKVADSLSLFSAMQIGESGKIMSQIPVASMFNPLSAAAGAAFGVGNMIFNRSKTLDQVAKTMGLTDAERQEMDDLDTEIRAGVLRNTPSKHHGSYNDAGDYMPADKSYTSGGSGSQANLFAPQTGTGTQTEAPYSPEELPDWLTGGGLSGDALIPTLNVGGQSIADIIAASGGGNV